MSDFLSTTPFLKHDGLAAALSLAEQLVGSQLRPYNPLIVSGRAGTGRSSLIEYLAGRVPGAQTLVLRATAGGPEVSLANLSFAGKRVVFVDDAELWGSSPVTVLEALIAQRLVTEAKFAPLFVLVGHYPDLKPGKMAAPGGFQGFCVRMGPPGVKTSGKSHSLAQWSDLVSHLAGALQLPDDPGIVALADGTPLPVKELVSRLEHIKVGLKMRAQASLIDWESSSADTPPARLAGEGDLLPRITRAGPKGEGSADTDRSTEGDEAAALPQGVQDLPRSVIMESLVTGNGNEDVWGAAQPILKAKEPRGLLIIAGPSGAGKSTHLAALGNAARVARAPRVGMLAGVAGLSVIAREGARLATALDALVIDDVDEMLAAPAGPAAVAAVLSVMRNAKKLVLLATTQSSEALGRLDGALALEVQRATRVDLLPPDAAMRLAFVDHWLKRAHAQADRAGAKYLAAPPVQTAQQLHTRVAGVASLANLTSQLITEAFLTSDQVRRLLVGAPPADGSTRAEASADGPAAVQPLSPPELDPERSLWLWPRVGDLLVLDSADGTMVARRSTARRTSNVFSGVVSSADDMEQALRQSSRRTGRLSIYGEPRYAEIYFREGRVVSAFLVNRQDRLGDYVVAAGYLSSAELDEALTEQRRVHEPLGAVLRRLGMMAEEDLVASLAYQMEEAVHEICGWTNASYTFTEGVQAAFEDSQVSLNVDDISLSMGFRADSKKQIATVVRNFDSVFRYTRDPASIEVDVNAIRDIHDGATHVAVLLDGERTLREVSQRLGMSEFRVGQIVWDLRHANSVEEVRRGVSKPQSRDDELAELRACARALVYAGLTDYARKAFERILARTPRDPQALFHLAVLLAETGDIDGARRGLEPLMGSTTIGRAARLNCAVLHSRAAARTPSLATAMTTLRGLGPSTDAAPTELLSYAAVLMASQEPEAYREAEGALLRFRREMNGAPLGEVYFFLLGNLGVVLGNTANARATFATGATHYPESYPLLGNFAYTLAEHGDLARASKAVAQALDANPTAAFLHALKGDIALREKRMAEGEEALLHAVHFDPLLGPKTYATLAGLAMEAGDAPRAAEFAQQALRLSPTPEQLLAKFAEQSIPTQYSEQDAGGQE